MAISATISSNNTTNASLSDSNNTTVVSATVAGAQGPAGGVATIEESSRADGSTLFYDASASGGAGAYVASSTTVGIAGTFTIDGGTF